MVAKAIFTTKVNPTYDDLPEERYHFPRRYLSRVQETVGDWIIYYEPRRTTGDDSSRGGRQSYFATARVSSIAEDRNLGGHYYALVSDFIEFLTPVPFRFGTTILESGLRHADGRLNQGAFQWAIRPLLEAEYDQIVGLGFGPVLAEFQDDQESDLVHGFSEPRTIITRPIIETVVKRPFRDRAFASQVCKAYDKRCAVSGLRIINGGGRPEVQAAHIKPVAQQGPDSIRNGLALSGTMHWLFDRGLISVDDDYSILTVNNAIPDEIECLLRRHNYQLILPETETHRPAPEYLEFHRRQIFKGKK